MRVEGKAIPGRWTHALKPETSNISVLETMIRARGLRMSRVNPTDDLLLPPSGRDADLEDYRAVLDHYAARLLLREVLKSESMTTWLKGRELVQRFCDPKAVDDFLSRLTKLGVLRESEGGFPVPVTPVRNFGPTYEWYTAMVLASEFGCPAIWGVTFENHGSGGDYDVMASLAGSLLYLEVKTSPPGRIEQPEISGFVDRLIDLGPDIAVFNNDTHLRMKDKIVPYMESVMEAMHGKRGERLHFKHLERDIFHLEGAVYITNSKPDLKRNMEVIFRHHFRSRSRVLDAITLGDNLMFDEKGKSIKY